MDTNIFQVLYRVGLARFCEICVALTGLWFWEMVLTQGVALGWYVLPFQGNSFAACCLEIYRCFAEMKSDIVFVAERGACA